jgi:hypothetical protein
MEYSEDNGIGSPNEKRLGVRGGLPFFLTEIGKWVNLKTHKF